MHTSETQSPYNFVPAKLPAEAFSYQHYMSMGLKKADAKRAVAAAKRERLFVSSGYQVAVNQIEAPGLGRGLWLSCKRRDKGVIEERQVLKEIMWALAPGHHGYELLPRADRVVDTANQYHVYAFACACPFADGELGEPVQVDTRHELRELAVPELQLPAPVKFLRVRREDGETEQDWRVLQQEKEKAVGDYEGALIHLPEGVDNPFEGGIVVLAGPELAFPFGFSTGLKLGSEAAKRLNATQRDFRTPE